MAASHDDHPHHEIAIQWLHQSLEACEDGATFRLLPMVTAAFLRLTTNPRIFPSATPLDDAVAFIDALAAAPGADMPSIGPEWPLLRQLCTDKSLTHGLPHA